MSGDQLARSPDGGATWEIILNPEEHGSDYAGAYRFFTSDSHPEVLLVYVLRDKKSHPVLMRTKNLLEQNPDDIRWEVIEVPRTGWLGGMAVHPLDSDKLWLAYTGYESSKKVWYYSGEVWVDVSEGLGWSVVESMVVDAQQTACTLGPLEASGHVD